MMHQKNAEALNTKIIISEFRKKQAEYIKTIKQLYEQNKLLRLRISQLQKRGGSISHRNKSNIRNNCIHISPHVSQPVSPNKNRRIPNSNFHNRNKSIFPSKSPLIVSSKEKSNINSSKTSIILNQTDQNKQNYTNRCPNKIELSQEIRQNDKKNVHKQKNWVYKTMPSQNRLEHQFISQKATNINITQCFKYAQNQHLQENKQGDKEQMLKQINLKNKTQKSDFRKSRQNSQVREKERIKNKKLITNQAYL